MNNSRVRNLGPVALILREFVHLEVEVKGGGVPLRDVPTIVSWVTPRLREANSTSILSGAVSRKTFHAIRQKIYAARALWACAGTPPWREEVHRGEAFSCHRFPAASRDEWKVPRVMSGATALELPDSWSRVSIHPVTKAVHQCRGSIGCTTASRRQGSTRLFSGVGSTCDGPMVHARQATARGVTYRSSAQGRQVKTQLLPGRQHDPIQLRGICTMRISFTRCQRTHDSSRSIRTVRTPSVRTQ